jgi:hypothetical protein
MMTSRIVQACSAIQLFVQRCLMNLEDGKSDPSLNVVPSAIDAEQWLTWRKRYRFWEANRKVFIYPENWILPELRDDKTPFFQELERELLQNDVTKDTVEQAFLNYLERLDDVARLDIRAMCWQQADDDGASGVVHVFGRTFNTPPVYYYRRLVVATAVWTPWEKLSLDIQGDHIIPAIYNGRLYLFWAIFESKPDKDQPEVESKDHIAWVAQSVEYQSYYTKYQWYLEEKKQYRNFQNTHTKVYVTDSNGKPKWNGDWTPEGQEPQQPYAPPLVNPPGNEPPFADKTGPGYPAVSHWEIMMAWSEYKQTKWTSKQISIDFVTVPSDEQKSAKAGDLSTWELPLQNSFTFGVGYPNDTLTIYVNRADGQHYGVQWVDLAGRFWLDDCRGALKAISSLELTLGEYAHPAGTQIDHMAFEATTGTSKLVIDTFPNGIGSGQTPLPYPVLNKMPSPYSVVYPLDDHPLNVKSVWLGDIFPFFYQDDRRTYFASPEREQAPAAGLSHPDKVAPRYNPIELAARDVLTFRDKGDGDPPIFEADASLLARI